MVYPTTIYVEFNYLQNDAGYEVWAVTGQSGQDGPGTIYMNWISGAIYFNTAGYTFFNSVRLQFGGGNPTSGTVNVLVF
jgi:hypothetical protein